VAHHTSGNMQYWVSCTAVVDPGANISFFTIRIKAVQLTSVPALALGCGELGWAVQRSPSAPKWRREPLCASCR